MRIACLILLTAFLGYSCSPERTSVAYVDPFIGTAPTHFISEWRSEGSTYPGAVAPHGKLQITPETSGPGDYLGGYYYDQDTIHRFSLAEHFSGWPNGSRGKGTFMPFSLPAATDVSFAKAKSSFDHSREEASPGYYQVYLEGSEISAAFAALPHAAIGRFTFEQAAEHGLLMGGYHAFQALSDHELELTIKSRAGFHKAGDNQLYLCVEFDSPFEIRDAGKYQVLTFPNSQKGNAIHFKCGASYTSQGNAKENVQSTIPKWDIEEIRKEARTLWEKELGRIEIPKGGETEKTIFYTALYHGSLLPINATDVNRQYPGYKDNKPLEPEETHYIYYTPWDSFRSLHPWVNLAHPRKGLDYMRSLVRIYNTTGQLPEPQMMTGVHLSVLVADALAKGIDDFDVPTVYKGLKEMILEPPYFRPDLARYDSIGYVPYPHRYATTATLEFALNDWALAQIATYLGEKETAQILLDRSLNYQNNYHPENWFMETRNADGTWAEASIYAEANPWNMSWFVPHDTRGLINLMGGDEAFSHHLERNFQEGHFVLDNECPVNFPFLFSHAGQPWKTMKWKQSVLEFYYNATPGGIPGNDDWGSMSNWYNWGAIGLFPTSPGTEELTITGPIFEEIVLHLPDGKRLSIQADRASKDHIYVQECRIDGVPDPNHFIRQSDLLNAETIYFRMGTEPNKDWGTSGEPPYSLTKRKPAFELLSLSSTKQEVSPHEPFQLEATIRNTGAPGSYPLFLERNGQLMDSSFVLVPEGQTRTIKLPLRLYQPGSIQLSTGGKSVSMEVKAKSVPESEAIRYTEPKVDALISLGDSIKWESTVQNISGQERTVKPGVFLDDLAIQTLEPVTLKPGETKTIGGSLAPVAEVGFHKLSLSGGPASRFKVIKHAREALVLHYTFDEAGSAIQDYSGFENHGEIVGQLEHTEGKKARGIKVENGHVKVPHSVSMDIKGSALTMLCWYKPGPKKGKSSLITKGAHHMLKLNNKWQVKLAVGGWGLGQCSFNSPVRDGEPAWLNQWSHFAGVRTKNELKVYYNGALGNRLTVNGGLGHTGFSWRIGSNGEIPIGRTPDGVIDEVMIFGRALSDAEIKAIYEAHAE